MTKYQDMHLADVELNKQFKQYMSAGQYDAALAILQNDQLTDKTVIAALFNCVTSRIVEVQSTSDPTFKQDRIKIAYLAPSGMTKGQVYFRLEREVTGVVYTIKTDAPMGLTPDEVILSEQNVEFISNGVEYSSLSVRDVSSGDIVGDYGLCYGNNIAAHVYFLETASTVDTSFSFRTSYSRVLEFKTEPTGVLLTWLNKNAIRSE